MKRFTTIALAALSIAALAACSGQNRNEREADSITRAIVNNNVSPVMKDFDPKIKDQLTRVRVAELSDQLNADGPYQGLKQNPNAQWCKTGYLCFDANFAKKKYHEFMQLGSDGKVIFWWIQPTDSQSA